MSYISIIISFTLKDKNAVASLSNALLPDNLTSPEYVRVKSTITDNRLVISINCRNTESAMHAVNDLLRCLKAAYDSLTKIKY